MRMLDGLYLYCDYRTNWEQWHCEYQRQYRQNKKLGLETKKEKTNKNNNNKLDEKFICFCGGSYSLKTSKYNHNKSKKHINYLNQQKLQDNLNTECLTVSITK